MKNPRSPENLGTPWQKTKRVMKPTHTKTSKIDISISPCLVLDPQTQSNECKDKKNVYGSIAFCLIIKPFQT